MWNSLPAHSACETPWTKLSPAIVSCATSGLTPTISGWSSVVMKWSAWPTVGRKMSPRGSFGFGSIAKRMLIALIAHVAREEVDRLAVALERVADPLGRCALRTLAAAPEHVCRGAELGPEVDAAHRLGDRRAAHAPGRCS